MNEEKFTGSLSQCEKYKIRYNDVGVNTSRWYTQTNPLTAVEIGDLISVGSNGETQVKRLENSEK